MRTNHRGTRTLLGLLAAGLFATAVAAEPGPPPPSPAMIVEWLKYGNERHAEGRHVHWHQSLDRRREVAAAEHPQAAIVTCSESAVPPEILFDQGLGDLYVVRVPGNVVGDRELAGIEYAVGQLGVSVVVVLGHQRCNLVAEAVRGASPSGHLGAILSSMAAPVARVKSQPGDVLDRAIQANVETGVDTLRDSHPILAPLVHANRLRVLGAVYSLDSGQVRWLAPKTHTSAISTALPH